jgi:hypothetical protein
MSEIIENPKLDVYYCIDLNNNFDLSYIEYYLSVYLNIYKKSYVINKFQNCQNYIIKNNTKNEDDVIKRGLFAFNKMYKNLKMKNSNETWYIYISNGDIQNIHKNAFVILINQNPCINKCMYIINKTELCILKTHSKEVKMYNSKLLRNTLDEIFISNKYINYSNLKENIENTT